VGLIAFDVRHDGITAELKVERKTPVTRESAPKYIGQPTQYAAADGAQLFEARRPGREPQAAARRHP
jgi:hypothetical protein